MYVCESRLTDEHRAAIQSGDLRFDSIDSRGQQWFYSDVDLIEETDPEEPAGFFARCTQWLRNYFGGDHAQTL